MGLEEKRLEEKKIEGIGGKKIGREKDWRGKKIERKDWRERLKRQIEENWSTRAIKNFYFKNTWTLWKTTKNKRANVINYQITKAGTSVYANYRAALRGRSKAEFFSKLSITVEEADETEMWLDLCISSGIMNDTFIIDLHKESLELLKILSNMRKNASN